MICGNCGSNNPDNNGFCYSCGAPLYAPVKKKSKKPIIISAIVLILIAIAVTVVLIIPKSSSSERASSTKVSTPEDVAKKYMKALQKGDIDKMEDCFLPGMCTWLRFNQTAVIENLVDYFKNQNGKIEYEFKDYKEYTGSNADESLELIKAAAKLDEDKIEEFGRLKVEFSLEGYTYTGTFNLMKYDKEWYLLLDPFNEIATNRPKDAHYPLITEAEEKANTATIDNSTIDNSKADTSKNNDTKDDSKKDDDQKNNSSIDRTSDYTPEDIVNIWCEAAVRGDDSVPSDICYPAIYEYNNITFLAFSETLRPYIEEGYSFEIDPSEIYDMTLSGAISENLSLIEDAYDFDRDLIEDTKFCSVYISLNNLDSAKGNSYNFYSIMPNFFIVKIDGNWYILDYIIY
jgi:hypothetical protein